MAILIFGHTDGTGAIPNTLFATISGGGTEYSADVITDSSNNSYVTGRTTSDGEGGSDYYIAKIDSSGSAVWQRTLGTSGNDFPFRLALDSSQNVYVAGYANGGSYAVLAKYNNSGVLQWQRQVFGTSFSNFRGIGIDDSDNIFVTGADWIGAESASRALIIRYDSSGNKSWQRRLGSTNTDTYRGIGVNGLYIYGVGLTREDDNAVKALVARYTNAGSLQWQKTLIADGGAGSYFYDAAVNSSGDVFVSGFATDSSGSGDNDMLIAKYNNSGVLQWQRLLGAANSDAGNSIAIDGSDNAYIIGESGDSNSKAIIAKYNSSGVLQWQREVYKSGNDEAGGIDIDSSGNIVFTTDNATSGHMLLGRIPADGSDTGTYGSYTYTTSSLTDNAGGLTDGTPTLTVTSTTITSQAGPLVDAAVSLTVTVL